VAIPNIVLTWALSRKQHCIVQRIKEKVNTSTLITAGCRRSGAFFHLSSCSAENPYTPCNRVDIPEPAIEKPARKAIDARIVGHPPAVSQFTTRLRARN
jgi:hypothetical protein